MTATVRVSRNGLKIPTNTAKGETIRTLRRMNPIGISPRVAASTGNRRKGTSPATSYLGKETTVTRKSPVAITLARGSRECTAVLR